MEFLGCVQGGNFISTSYFGSNTPTSYERSIQFAVGQGSEYVAMSKTGVFG